MPEISRFFGIVITMYADDHTPPHFHARHGDYEALINIENGEIVRGFMPKKELRLIGDWVELHKEELFSNFEESQKDDLILKKLNLLIRYGQYNSSYNKDS